MAHRSKVQLRGLPNRKRKGRDPCGRGEREALRIPAVSMNEKVHGFLGPVLQMMIRSRLWDACHVVEAEMEMGQKSQSIERDKPFDLRNLYHRILLALDIKLKRETRVKLSGERIANPTLQCCCSSSKMAIGYRRERSGWRKICRLYSTDGYLSTRATQRTIDRYRKVARGY